MKKLTAIQQTEKVMREVKQEIDLTQYELWNEFQIWRAVTKIVKSNTMELRAQYVSELIKTIADLEKEKANA
jgi:hypothetical protein